jgi:sulfonate dioxygenase
MAPSAVQETQVADVEGKVHRAFDEKKHSQYKYAHYLPVYDNVTTFPPTELFEFVDRGISADKAKPHLFGTNDPNNTITATKLTPRIGTEIKGVQLSQLTDVQKNELALLIGERGVVVFRGQDFKDIGADQQKKFGEYFGKLHVHVSKSGSCPLFC